MTFCIWEGRPAVWTPGEAWAVVRGSWERVDSSDVGNSAKIVPEADWRAKFPDLPPLPSAAFQTKAQPQASASRDQSSIYEERIKRADEWEAKSMKAFVEEYQEQKRQRGSQNQTVPQERPFAPAAMLAMGRTMQVKAGDDEELARYGVMLEAKALAAFGHKPS